MDLKSLKRKLIALDQTSKGIQEECGYTAPSNSMKKVEMNSKDPDSCFLYHELKDILNVLDFVHYKLDYLQRPITEEGILQYNKKKGYELNGKKLNYDDRIEVLATDEQTQTSKWELHYLTDYAKLDGIRARIRE